MKIWYFALSLVTFSAYLVAAPPPRGSDRLLVQPRLGADPAAVTAALVRAGTRLHKTLGGINVHVLEAPGKDLEKVSGLLMKTGLFTYVERDQVMEAAVTPVTPNDPYFSSQWHLPAINAPSAWTITTGTSGVIIAVIDSGADWTHPDLAPNLVTGWNFVTGTSNTQDNAGHGTAVSGTAAAASNNGIGATGVSWNNKIMPLEVLNSTTAATYSAVASAITYAADHGARIINISLCGSASSSTLQSAESYAWNKGSVIFAAAGNSSSTAPNYPAADPNVVAVSATESNGTLSSFSNYGTWIDVAAPGDYILTTTMGGGYGQWYGTSFSSPIAAAVAALALSKQPGMSAAALVNLIENNADQLGGYTSYNQYFGYGQVDAYKAVLAASTNSGGTTPPAVSINNPTGGSTLSGTVSVQGAATDSLSISNVQFYVDNQLVTSGANSSFNFGLNTINYTNGSHTLKVTATDTAGNTGAASTSVTVSNVVQISKTPPVVSITSPLPGATVNGNGSISIVVSVSDVLPISQVSIYVDGTLLCNDTAAPYSCSWNIKKAVSGQHTIKATAWDSAGNTASTNETVYRR